jgi:hypothetical protein
MRRRDSTATRAARIARAVVYRAGEQLPERDQLADLTRRATDRLAPSRRRTAKRRRRRRSLARIVAPVAAGLLAGRLTVAKRSAPAWRAVNGQLARAGGGSLEPALARPPLPRRPAPRRHRRTPRRPSSARHQARRTASRPPPRTAPSSIPAPSPRLLRPPGASNQPGGSHRGFRVARIG